MTTRVFPDAHVYGSFNLAYGVGESILYSFRVLQLIGFGQVLVVCFFFEVNRSIGPSSSWLPQSGQSYVGRFTIMSAARGQ